MATGETILASEEVPWRKIVCKTKETLKLSVPSLCLSHKPKLKAPPTQNPNHIYVHKAKAAMNCKQQPQKFTKFQPINVQDSPTKAYARLSLAQLCNELLQISPHKKLCFNGMTLSMAGVQRPCISFEQNPIGSVNFLVMSNYQTNN